MSPSQSPTAPGGRGGLESPLGSSPWERPRSGGSEEATLAGAVLSDADSCARLPKLFLSEPESGRAGRASRHPVGQYDLSR